MTSRVKTPVFIDTNLGTRIAIDVCPDINAEDFKRYIEGAHLNCFPNVGDITVTGLMVKRKSHFYHLPDSFPIKYAFQGSKGTWFLHMEAYSQSGFDKSGLSECLDTEIRDQPSNSSDIKDCREPKNFVSSAKTNNVNCKGKRRGKKGILSLKASLRVILGFVHSKRKKMKRVKKNHFLNSTIKGNETGELFASSTEEWRSSAILENPGETTSATVSVSGIIKKYFSDYEEVTLSSNFTTREKQSQCKEQSTTGVDDTRSEAKFSPMTQFTPKTPPRILLFPLATDISSKPSRNKFKRTEVGKRLVVASNKLRISASTQKSASGLCRFGDRKLSVPKSSSLVRGIVFEISDSDE
ncbi:Cell wall integrity and stress response component 3 like [Actinidia chinensis var. chinensis]|uniref:Cell wall integrity and stress response component 3 like n=1 Tax=Actinidia chinensis var. chinensis TaxID=1590841 RepID=A0A2R6PR52_ACTCC|nr:Cell wall integrity and stress response component 3 like [Actinidia chinensis var. chinensis]